MFYAPIRDSKTCSAGSGSPNQGTELHPPINFAEPFIDFVLLFGNQAEGSAEINSRTENRRSKARVSRFDSARYAALGGQGAARGRRAGVGHHGDGRMAHSVDASSLRNRQQRRPARRRRNAGAGARGA
jgi:hypothetical protein